MTADLGLYFTAHHAKKEDAPILTHPLSGSFKSFLNLLSKRACSCLLSFRLNSFPSPCCR